MKKRAFKKSKCDLLNTDNEQKIQNIKLRGMRNWNVIAICGGGGRYYSCREEAPRIIVKRGNIWIINELHALV